MLAFGFVAGRAADWPNAETVSQGVRRGSDQPDKLDRTEVEAIVRDYLLKNPEVLLEVQQALEEKQQEEQRLAAARRHQGRQGRDLQSGL